MANQPTKYKKFVATAATATLVASAIVPVASAASFSDVNEDQAQYVDALVAQGIIKGFEDGTFKPNQAVNRGQVVKMLGKWVEAQGFAEPTDWETVQRFTDLPVTSKDKELLKYAAVVADSNVFNGVNGTDEVKGALNAGGKITRENMALVLNRAYLAVYGVSLVDFDKSTEDIDVADLVEAKEEAREAIQAVRNLGLSTVANFNPKDDVTRANFAKFLSVAIDKAEEGEITTPDQGEVAIVSTKATGATQLTVEFNKAVDTNAAAFDLKRGNTAVKVKDVDWNEAGTVAVVELETRFAAATYNLTVTGVSEEALTASVTTTVEVPTEIRFNSPALVLTGQEVGENNIAKITFDVYNQYGEIITDSVPTSKYDKDVKLKGIKNDKIEVTDKGVLTALVDSDEDDGETGTIEITFEDGDLEFDVTHEVTLSDEVESGTATIEGVHSNAGYEFTAANVEKVFEDKTADRGKFTDDFVLLFTLKDQFGAPIDPSKVYEGTEDEFEKVSSSDTSYIGSLEKFVDGLRFSVSNDNIFDLDDTVRSRTAEEPSNISIINVDGKYYFAAHMAFEFEGKYVEQAGENTVTIRSKATGEEVSSKIVLESSAKVHSVSVSTPVDTVAGSEDVYLPVVAKNAEGETIVDAALLNDLTRSSGDEKPEIDVTLGGALEIGKYTFVEQNGEIFLKVKTVKVTDEDGEDADVSIEVVNTDEESEIEFTVEEDAYAERIASIGGTKAIYHTRNEKVELKNIVIEDQYGRVFKDVDGEYSVKVTVKDPSKFSLASADSGTINTSKKSLPLIPKAGAEGSSSLDFELFNKDNQSLSKVSSTYRLVDEDNFVSYEVGGTDLIYGTDVDPADFDLDAAVRHDVKVYGITGAGEKVRVAENKYTVISNPYLTTTSSDTAAVFITEDANEDLNASSGTTVLETSYTVIISKTGQAISRDVKVSDAKRKLASLNFKDTSKVTGSLTSTDFEFTTSELTDVKGISGLKLFAELQEDAAIELEDQYGFEDGDGAYELSIANEPKTGALAVKFGEDGYSNFSITVSKISNDDVTVANNGRNGDLNVKGLEVNDSFVLTLTVNGVSKSVLVHVTDEKAAK